MEDAYRGNFEGQTQLKIELLSKLLNWMNRERIVHDGVKKCSTSML